MPSRNEIIATLKRLLEEGFESALNPWISKSAIEMGDFRISRGKGAPINALKEIYSRRGRRNHERGSPIEGFEILLKNLNATKSRKILIHEWTDRDRRKYFIFTDSNFSEIIGVLRFPDANLD